MGGNILYEAAEELRSFYQEEHSMNDFIFHPGAIVLPYDTSVSARKQ